MSLRDRTPAERAAILDRTSSTDPELRAEALALLERHERLSGFLEQSPRLEAEPRATLPERI